MFIASAQLDMIASAEAEDEDPEADDRLFRPIIDKANDLTAQAAMAFFWARVAHAVVYIAGWPYVRTLAFVVSWISIAVIFWQVMF